MATELDQMDVPNLVHKHLGTIASIGALSLAQHQSCSAQQVTGPRGSLAGEAAAEQQARAASASRYNIQFGPGQFSVSAGVRGEYTDNVFLQHSDTRDDYILSPRVNLGAFFPVGQLNTFSVDLGLAFYHYFNNDELNSDTPLINPDSELAFRIYTGDFAIKLSDSFSYQESPFHEYGASYYNVYNTGRFARFDNRVGPSVTWDQEDLIVTASYTHENFFSNGAAYNYVDRASELFQADAMFVVTPSLTAGLEANGSVNTFDNQPLNDQWRAGAGPAVRWGITEYLTARLGGGYEMIQYTDDLASRLGITSQNTYYFYGNLTHVINRFFRHSLTASHDNQIGINAGNLEGTHISYDLNWLARQYLTISPTASVSFYDESYNSGTALLYHEKFTYWSFGLAASYELDPRWRVSGGWYYRLKDSDYESSGYSDNLVRLEVMYRF